MAKAITNTLSRWHKIAERIKIAANESRQETLRALQTGANIDPDAFAVRRETLQANAGEALTTGFETVLKLQGAVATVREALARANVQHGVSDLLNRTEKLKQELAFVSECLSATEGKLSVSEMEQLVARRKENPGTPSPYSHLQERLGVSFATDEQVTKLKARRDEVRRKLNALSDKVSTANASTMTLELDEDVIALAGLSEE